MRRFLPYHESLERRDARAALWLAAESLTLERAAGTNRLAAVARPWLFRKPYAAAQPRLLGLDEAGWLKALTPGEYAARKPSRPATLQEALFAYLDALQGCRPLRW